MSDHAQTPSRPALHHLIRIGVLSLLAGALAAADPDYRTDALGYVPYWIGAGPFPINPKKVQRDTVEEATIPDEGALAPAIGETLKIGDTEATWKPATVADGTTEVDGQRFFGKHDGALFYLVAYVELDRDIPDARAYWGSDDNGEIFVNGKPHGLFAWDAGRTCVPDADCAEHLELKKGINTIVIKLVNLGGPYGAGVRLADGDGEPIAGARILAAPAGKEVPAEPWTPVKTPDPLSDEKMPLALTVGQCGYNTAEEKLAIATGPIAKHWDTVTVRDAGSDEVVYTIPKDGGEIRRVGYQYRPGEFITRVYFGGFKKPGRYVLASADGSVRSLAFDIADNAFAGVATDMARAFFFWRQGQDFDEAHAGKWAGKAFHSREDARKAQVHAWAGGDWTSIGGKVIDETERDVFGGWYDAGDPNKYTGNENYALAYLLMAYDVNRDLLGDGELNLPESGNGVPDLLDETRFTSEYLLRIQREDGAVFDRVSHSKIPQLAEACSGATLYTVAGLAWSAASWRESGLDDAFASRCLAAAEKSLHYLDEHPGPWPVDDKGKPRNIGSINWGYYNLDTWHALAASALFRATGNERYRTEVEDYLRRTDLVSRWDAHVRTWKTEDIFVLHNYALAKGADPALVADAGARLASEARRVRDEVGKDRRKHLYGSGSRDGYYWGVNSGIANHASLMLWWAWRYAPEAERAEYAQAAGEYLQFLLGRQASRWCFVTNLGHLGAQHSLPGMFSFMSQSMRDDLLPPTAAKPDRLGMFPGFLVGGPAWGVASFDFIADDRKDLHNMHWIPFEPDIIYQSPAVFLTTFLSHRAVAWRGGH